MNTTLKSYLETALWADLPDDEDDSGYSTDDFSDEAIVQASEDLSKFFTAAANVLAHSKYDYEHTQVAHDFWLTRNRHGAGFWDGDYDKDLGDVLTALAHTFKEICVYVGDDGRIYFS